MGAGVGERVSNGCNRICPRPLPTGSVLSNPGTYLRVSPRTTQRRCSALLIRSEPPFTPRFTGRRLAVTVCPSTPSAAPYWIRARETNDQRGRANKATCWRDFHYRRRGVSSSVGGGSFTRPTDSSAAQMIHSSHVSFRGAAAAP